MSEAWKISLREYNKGKPQYLIPKKGTAEHSELMKIYEKNKSVKPEVKTSDPDDKLVQPKRTYTRRTKKDLTKDQMVEEYRKFLDSKMV